MRNTDTAPQRFTSLAWAAVLGHEETFEFLLSSGHDDDELSRVRFCHLDYFHGTAFLLTLSPVGLRE